MKQDEMELREENMVDKKDNNFDNPNDVLALLQDYTDKESNSMEPRDTEQSLLDDMEFDNTDDDLLALLDMIAEQDQTVTADTNIYALEEEEQSLEEEEQSLEEDLTYQYENVNDDILALNDLWDEDMDLAITESLHDEYGDSNYKDSSSLGDIFSDVLGAVNLEKETDVDKFGGSTNMSVDGMVTKGEDIKAPKKKGLFSKLFKDEKENTTDLREQNTKETSSDKKQEEGKKKTPIKATKNSNKQSSGDVKKEKKASSKKEKKKASSKTEKKVLEKKPIKPKKAKNKLGEKIIKDVHDKSVIEKPLNKKLVVALSIMMISFCILIVFGSRAYTESLSTRNATTNFERKRYNEAYNELYGMPRNNKNKDIYDKVMTVMYVNKHLNTYNSYYTLELYPQALDSLIKGLQRYEQYIDRATDLGIENDLDNIKSNILKELDSKFNVAEKKAIKLAEVEDNKEYSKNVYTIVANNKK